MQFQDRGHPTWHRRSRGKEEGRARAACRQSVLFKKGHAHVHLHTAVTPHLYTKPVRRLSAHMRFCFLVCLPASSFFFFSRDGHTEFPGTVRSVFSKRWAVERVVPDGSCGVAVLTRVRLVGCSCSAGKSCTHFSGQRGLTTEPPRKISDSNTSSTHEKTTPKPI